MPLEIQKAQSGAAILVQVVPRAARNEVAGMQGSAIKIRLCAPPVEGAANEALVQFLAKRLRVRPGDVEIVGGHTSRRKLVSIVGLTPDEVQERLLGE